MAKNKQTASTNIGGLLYSLLQSVSQSVVLGIEPQASCLLDRHATPELHTYLAFLEFVQHLICFSQSVREPNLMH